MSDAESHALPPPLPNRDKTTQDYGDLNSSDLKAHAAAPRLENNVKGEQAPPNLKPSSPSALDDTGVQSAVSRDVFGKKSADNYLNDNSREAILAYIKAEFPPEAGCARCRVFRLPPTTTKAAESGSSVAGGGDGDYGVVCYDPELFDEKNFTATGTGDGEDEEVDILEESHGERTLLEQRLADAADVDRRNVRFAWMRGSQVTPEELLGGYGAAPPVAVSALTRAYRKTRVALVCCLTTSFVR